jgi:DNA replication protein DnaC
MSTATGTAPIDPLLARFIMASREGQQTLGNKLDELPSSRPCDRHDGHTAVLNRERSLKEGEPIYYCPDCVEAARVLRWAKAQQEAGIPLDVRHATLANFELYPDNLRPEFNTPEDFVMACHDFLQRSIHHLILGGSVGIGKGHLAAAVANTRLRNGYSVAWIRCDDLFDLVHSTYHQTRGKNIRLVKADIIDHYSTKHLLILDEIALKSMPADGEEILFGIIDHRYQNKLQTLMTTNQPYSRLEEWFGDRLWSRLHSPGTPAPKWQYGVWGDHRRS